MSCAVVPYILAVAKFLKSLPTPDEAVEAQQVSVLAERLQVKGPEDAADIVVALQELPVSTEHLKGLIAKTTSLAMQAQGQQTAFGKRATQDYSVFWKYMTEGKLELFRQSSHHIKWLVQEVSRLRLTNPSEATFQMLAALLLMIGKNENTSGAIKYETMLAVKAEFVRLKQRSVVGFPILPEPSELSSADPDLAKSFFGEGGPGVCPIDPVSFTKILMSIPMRSSRKDSKVQHITINSNTDHMAMQFAQSMSSQMQQMQQLQQMTLCALGGGLPSTSSASTSRLSMLGQSFASAPQLTYAAPVPPAPQAQAAQALMMIESPKEETPERQEPAHAETEERVDPNMSLSDVTKQLQESMLEAKSRKSREAADNKKSSAAGSVMKKPARASAIKTKSVTVTSKKPATRSSSVTLTMQQRKRLRPIGCGKCRNTPGCTDSCFSDSFLKAAKKYLKA